MHTSPNHCNQTRSQAGVAFFLLIDMDPDEQYRYINEWLNSPEAKEFQRKAQLKAIRFFRYSNFHCRIIRNERWIRTPYYKSMKATSKFKDQDFLQCITAFRFYNAENPIVTNFSAN